MRSGTAVQCCGVHALVGDRLGWDVEVACVARSLLSSCAEMSCRVIGASS